MKAKTPKDTPQEREQIMSAKLEQLPYNINTKDNVAII